MKSSQLHDVWASPDNTRLVSKQFSFRFPVHIAAKIAALAEIYPQKNRTQIVADLLTVALDDLEKNLPMSITPIDEHHQQIEDEIAYHQGIRPEALFELNGARARFRNIANKHFVDLEKELGNEEPINLYEVLCGSKEYIMDALK